MAQNITENTYVGEFAPQISLIPIIEEMDMWSGGIYTIDPDVIGTKTKNRQSEFTNLLQNGNTCNFTDKGDTNITEYVITANPIKVNISQCFDEYLGTAFERLLPKGLNIADITDVDELMDAIALGISQATNKQLYNYGWFGEAVVGGSVEVPDITSWFERLETCGNTINVATTGTLVADEAADILKSAYELNPLMFPLKPTEKVFLVTDEVYFNLMDTYESNGLGNWLAMTNLKEGQPTLAYRGVEVVQQSVWSQTIALNSLTNPHRVVYTKKGNMVIGTDVSDSPVNVGRVWYDELTEFVYFKNRFRFGTQIEFCEYTVYAR